MPIQNVAGTAKITIKGNQSPRRKKRIVARDSQPLFRMTKPNRPTQETARNQRKHHLPEHPGKAAEIFDIPKRSEIHKWMREPRRIPNAQIEG